MNAPALLDANVLIALFDLRHVHHNIAHDWFADNRARGWATSPLTENALLRIVSNLKYGSNSERTPLLAARLRTFCATADHHFGVLATFDRTVPIAAVIGATSDLLEVITA